MLIGNRWTFKHKELLKDLGWSYHNRSDASKQKTRTTWSLNVLIVDDKNFNAAVEPIRTVNVRNGKPREYGITKSLTARFQFLRNRLQQQELMQDVAQSSAMVAAARATRKVVQAKAAKTAGDVPKAAKAAAAPVPGLQSPPPSRQTARAAGGRHSTSTASTATAVGVDTGSSGSTSAAEGASAAVVRGASAPAGDGKGRRRRSLAGLER